jgi:hypothetical protein
MTFKEYMLHQLREMRRELLTATTGLEGEDLTSFEPAGHWPVAWITEHCTEVADKFLYKPLHGKSLLEYPPHIGAWTKREPKPGDEYPELDEMQSRWCRVCDTAIGFVEGASDEEIQKQYGAEPYVNSILRVVNHTNSHLRSLWCILGERRVDGKWAEQQSFLA